MGSYLISARLYARILPTCTLCASPDEMDVILPELLKKSTEGVNIAIFSMHHGLCVGFHASELCKVLPAMQKEIIHGTNIFKQSPKIGI